MSHEYLAAHIISMAQTCLTEQLHVRSELTTVTGGKLRFITYGMRTEERVHASTGETYTVTQGLFKLLSQSRSGKVLELNFEEGPSWVALHREGKLLPMVADFLEAVPSAWKPERE